MATSLEVSRTFLRHAAAALDAKDPAATQLCAMAKRFATDTCFQICDEALQLHGGYGYIKEYGLERYLRDLRVHRILEGTNEIMRVLTVFSAILLPLTLIAGIYGMNFDHMPELHWLHGYAFALSLMAITALGLLIWFRRRGWVGRRMS